MRMSTPKRKSPALVDASLRIGEHLSARRRLWGITQDDLAIRAGISRRTLANIEAGDASVSMGRVLAVARILGAMDKVVEAFSPLSSPEGLHRMNSQLPKRVRRV